MEKTEIFVNRNYSIIEVPLSNDEYILYDVMSIDSIDLNESVLYKIEKLDNVITVKNNDKTYTGILIDKTDKYITIKNGERIFTTKYDQYSQLEFEGQYRISLLSNFGSDLKLRYATNSIKWDPKIVIWLNDKIAKMVYTALLSSTKDRELKGKISLSLYDQLYTSNRNYYGESTSIPGAKMAIASSPNDDNDSKIDSNRYKKELGNLSLIDNLSIALESEDVKITKSVFIDLSVWNDNIKKDHCIEGFYLYSPFYFPSSTVTIYDDIFSTSFPSKSYQREEFMEIKTKKSQTIRYILSGLTTVKGEQFKEIKTTVYNLKVINDNKSSIDGVISFNIGGFELMKVVPLYKEELQKTRQITWIIKIPIGESTHTFTITYR